MPGSVSVLTTRGSENYYHFLTDVLPRIELLRLAGVDSDQYLVNRQTRFQRDLLDHVGITADRCLSTEKYPHLRADELYRAVVARRRPCAPRLGSCPGCDASSFPNASALPIAGSTSVGETRSARGGWTTRPRCWLR